MNNLNLQTRDLIFKHTLAGIGLGLVFPVLATVIRLAQGAHSIFEVQASDPLIWIIDTAPFILGFFGYMIGTRHAHVEHMAREQREQNNQQLALSAKMSSLGEMAGNVAHEINNPLTVIMGKAGILLKRFETHPVNLEKAREDVLKILKTAGKISKIIAGLKSFSRNSEKDPPENTMISKIVEETLDLCQERFKNGEVDLKLELQSDPEICCRASQIEQVMLNLLSNAYDAVHGKSGAWVELKVSVEEEWAVITITDCGTGIDPIVVSKMMEPFFTTKQVNKGTGLGLSISKTIVDEHRGSLKYDASFANTRFVLKLPKAPVI